MSSVASPARVGVLRLGGEFHLLSAEVINTGDLVIEMTGELTNQPSRYTVQIDDHCHIEVGGDHDLCDILDNYSWRFMNHHCDPNTVIRGRAVYATRDILPWEEITFDYDTTEYEMAEPFDCRCNSAICRGRIQGFKFLSESDQERLRPLLAPHLLRTLDAAIRLDTDA